MEKVYVLSTNASVEDNNDIIGIFRTLELAKKVCSETEKTMMEKYFLYGGDCKWLSTNSLSHYSKRCVGKRVLFSYKRPDKSPPYNVPVELYICEWDITDYPINIKGAHKSLTSS